MRRRDKLNNIEKANILAEQRYLQSKGYKSLIKENNDGFDFEAYIDNVNIGLTDADKNYVKYDLREFLKLYKKDGYFSDEKIKELLDKEIEKHKAYFSKRQEEENAELVKQEKIKNILNSKKLLGQKIIDIGEFSLALEDGSHIYIDNFGRDRYITYEKGDTHKFQAAETASDFNFSKREYLNGDTENVIFQNKSDAKLLLQLFKLYSGRLPDKIRLRYIFTPEDVENDKTREIPKDTFNDLENQKVAIDYFGDEKEYQIVSIDFKNYNYNPEFDEYTVSMTFKPTDAFSDYYYLTYKLKIGKFRNTRKESIKLEKRGAFSSESDEVKYNTQPDIMRIINEIRRKFN
jgi:hypothetical protein